MFRRGAIYQNGLFIRKSLTISTFLGMRFFIVVVIGMVLEPQHLGVGSTYFCGAEGNFLQGP